MNSVTRPSPPVIPAERSERRDPPCGRKGGANWPTAHAAEKWIPAQGRDDDIIVVGGVTS